MASLFVGAYGSDDDMFDAGLPFVTDCMPGTVCRLGGAGYVGAYFPRNYQPVNAAVMSEVVTALRTRLPEYEIVFWSEADDEDGDC